LWPHPAAIESEIIGRLRGLQPPPGSALAVNLIFNLQLIRDFIDRSEVTALEKNSVCHAIQLLEIVLYHQSRPNY
jgi:hypothetical protein